MPSKRTRRSASAPLQRSERRPRHRRRRSVGQLWARSSSGRLESRVALPVGDGPVRAAWCGGHACFGIRRGVRRRDRGASLADGFRAVSSVLAAGSLWLCARTASSSGLAGRRKIAHVSWARISLFVAWRCGGLSCVVWEQRERRDQGGYVRIAYQRKQARRNCQGDARNDASHMQCRATPDTSCAASPLSKLGRVVIGGSWS